MKRNIGSVDRIFRFAIGFAAIMLGVKNTFSDILMMNLLIILGSYALLTAVCSRCIMYTFLKIRTIKKKDTMY